MGDLYPDALGHTHFPIVQGSRKLAVGFKVCCGGVDVLCIRSGAWTP